MLQIAKVCSIKVVIKSPPILDSLLAYISLGHFTLRSISYKRSLYSGQVNDIKSISSKIITGCLVNWEYRKIPGIYFNKDKVIF